MNDGYPPLQLGMPESRQRRKVPSPGAPLPPDKLARRREIAAILKSKVDQLGLSLRSLSDSERKAVFYKIENEIPFTKETIGGIDLKAISQPTPEIIYAIPQLGNLDKFAQKIDDFGSGPERNGFVPNKWVAFLKEISLADPKERLTQDLRDRYESLIASEWIVCEIELFTLLQGANKRRLELESWIGELRQAFRSGVDGNVFEFEMALPTCRAVIRCKGSLFRQLVEEPKWIERIRWIESKPRFQTFTETVEAFRFQDLSPIDSPATDAPTVCIVDSGVTAGNPFLQPTTRAELVRSFLKSKPDNPNDEHGHGSAVASLAAYHAINIAAEAVNTPRLWIASARILNEHNQLEDERLFSKVLSEVVATFVPLGVRIFCLAVGDDRKIWGPDTRRELPRKSWVARRIDQLSREHDIVFVVCTGNLTCHDVQDYLSDGHAYPGYLLNEGSGLLDPSQAGLALTVGSIVPGTTIIGQRDTAFALTNQPSPFTRSGPGIRRETKPEVVEYGGNYALDGSMNRVRENRGLQIPAASRQLTPAVSFWTGTSFAAPRIVHRLGLIDYDMRAIGVTASASLLKALLVNSARHRATGDELQAVRDVLGNDDPESLHCLLGYGLPDHSRATGCDDYSTVMYFQGEVQADNVLFFDVPVPGDFVRSTGTKRLTVTVAHAPEVQKWGLERYFGLDVKWRMFRGDKSRDEIVDAMSETDDESDEETLFDLFDDDEAVPELPSELAFRPPLTLRSRGTIQHAEYDWTRHSEDYSAGHYTLAVAAYKRWQRNVAPTPVAVVVRIEELRREVAIYARVQELLAEVRT